MTTLEAAAGRTDPHHLGHDRESPYRQHTLGHADRGLVSKRTIVGVARVGPAHIIGFGSKLKRKLGSVEQCFDLLPNGIDGVSVWAQLQPKILSLSIFTSRQNRVDRYSCCAHLLSASLTRGNVADSSQIARYS
jgi:hypothetical protein